VGVRDLDEASEPGREALFLTIFGIQVFTEDDLTVQVEVDNEI
jgi:hypothetical protein